MPRTCEECGLTWLDGRYCEHHVGPDERALVIFPDEEPLEGFTDDPEDGDA